MAVDFAIPDNAEDMQDFLTAANRADHRRQLFAANADPSDLVTFMNSYAKLTNKADPGIAEQATEQANRILASMARDGLVEFRVGGPTGRKATPADLKTQRQAGTRHSRLAVGAKLDGEFENLWDFLEVTHPKSDPRTERISNLRTKIENAMSSTDPASGGFLIPEEFRATLMEYALESALVRPRARVIPMQSLRISMPFVDSTSNVSSVYGGVVGYWTEEGAALVQSQPAFGRIALEAKKLTAYTEVPNELRRDSAISVETLISDIFPAAIGWFEDIAFMFGSGAGEPLGLFNSQNNAIVSAAAVSGQDGVSSPTGASIVWDNIVSMYSRMLPTSLNSAVWIVSPAALPQLLTTALSVGTGGALVGMAAGGGSGTPVPTLLGRPVIVSEKVGNLGFAGDVNFVDFSQYLIGDRMQMESETSTDYKFGNDVTAYRFIERVDGRPWLQSAITPRNGGPTLSPYVQLAARP
jgi:HK97 family phage major capsid protein